MHVRMSSGSDCGLVRRRNEDTVLVLPEHGLAILSDGMGGHQAGDIASRIAVDVVADFLTGQIDSNDSNPTEISALLSIKPEDLSNALEAANAEILMTARDRAECYGMGATIVVASVRGGRFVAAHLGDSRAYRMRGRDLQQLTEDHTLAQQYLREGGPEILPGRIEYARSMLLKGLGIADDMEPDITERELAADDVFLLCSDGLTDAVSDENIRDILLGGGNDNLEKTVADLIDAANKNGGPDNISVVLIQVEG